MAIVVELLSRGGSPLKHFVFNQQQISLGRDFDNDIRLDDPFVDPQHLIISQSSDNDALYFADKQSLNGTRRNGRLSLNGLITADDKLKLGRTRLRAFVSGANIAPTLKLSVMEEKTEWLNNLYMAIVSMLILGFISLFLDYMHSFQEFQLVKQIPKAIGKLAVLSLWPLGFALLSKLNRRESRLVTQFNLMWIFMILLVCLSYFEQVLRFNLVTTSILDWLMLGILGGVLWGFIWLCLFIAFHQPDRKRRMIASLVCLLMMLPFGYTSVYQKDNFSTKPNYSRVLMPPTYNLSAPVSTGRFLQRSEALFEQVSAESKQTE